MRLSHEQYKTYKNRRSKTSPELKQVVLNEPLEKEISEGGDSKRSTVCILSFTTRPKDEDNPCPKYHIDALRYEGIIPNDTRKDIDLFIDEFRVKTKKEERTEIYILKED